MADRRREETARYASFIEGELGGTVQGVADLPPMDQVAAVMDRQPREVGEGRVHEVEVFPDPADGWIGVEAREDGVVVLGASRHGEDNDEDAPAGK